MMAKTQPAQTPEHNEDFSLVLGGPLYQLLLHSGMIKPPFGRLSSRIGVLTGVAWLPLVLFTILGGRFAQGVAVPFLRDFEVHARLLFSLPMLILAELVVYIRMRAIVSQFLERRIVTEDIRPAFNSIIASATRLRNSTVAELALLIAVFAGGPWLWRSTSALQTDTWYATATSSGLAFTTAGWWYGFISIPVFQFILLRWYYRLFIWFRFLFQTARLDLNLLATHPDRCGGLAFLGNVSTAFAPVLMAHSALLSGFLANRIVHEGAKLPDFKIEVAAVAVLLLAIVLIPLCFFAPKLHHARLGGYGLTVAWQVSMSVTLQINGRFRPFRPVSLFLGPPTFSPLRIWTTASA